MEMPQNGNGPKSNFGSISFFFKENELGEKVKKLRFYNESAFI